MNGCGTNRRAAAAFAIAAILAAAVELSGLYFVPEIRAVPVARLVANLERELAAKPKDPELHVQLARLYGMAYAVNAEELPATGAPGAAETVWFGHEPNLIPYQVKPVPPGSRTEASRRYLQKAIEHYRQALQLNPASLPARLGHGWASQQAGETATAIAEYRKVIEQAWPKEEGTKFASLGQRFYTQEAAGYLIPLLDPQRDAAEIDELRRRMNRLTAMPRPITPVAVPLSSSATLKTIVDLDAKVLFDADGSGLRRQWTWISPEAGWLVYDPGRRGAITSALQMFGNVTFWLFWRNGFDALAALDDDRNGELAGAELRYLAIWRDADRDGVSDRGEVRPIADHGIAALSCRYTAGDGLLVAAQSPSGVRFSDGATRPTYDIILRPSISVSAPEPAPATH